MHKPNGCCKRLIEVTTEALNNDVVTLMFVAVQRSNLELSIKQAVKKWVGLYKNGELLHDNFPMQYMSRFSEWCKRYCEKMSATIPIYLGV